MSATGSARALLAWAAAAALAFGLWWVHGRPVALPDASSAKLSCVSYAPFQGAQTPTDPALGIPAAQMDADLRRLAERFDCVRTYSVALGQDAIPALAATHGLKVMLGIWISRDGARNAAEIARAIEVANAHPGTVRSIIVGNEVLLRRELPPERLEALIREVKAAVRVPVSYADVWEFWLRNAALARSVDFVTVHILPYWEDVPVDAAHALDHVRAVVAKVKLAFPEKPILVGETGWPSAGRAREGAVPGRVNQARFVREFVAHAEATGLDYNLIEAFDQPWKRALEGTVGGYWGLYDGRRAPKFGFKGPVSEDPRWRLHWLASAGLGALAILAVLARGRRLSTARWIALAAGSVAAGTVLVTAAEFVGTTSLGLRAWLFGAAGLGLAAAASVALGAAAALDAPPRPAPLAQALDWLARPWRLRPRAPIALALLQGGAVSAAAAVTLALAVDGRYRDFPAFLFAIPAVAFALLRWSAPPGRVEELWLGRLLALGALGVGALEGAHNPQALGWSAVALLLAWPWTGLGRAVDWGHKGPAA